MVSAFGMINSVLKGIFKLLFMKNVSESLTCVPVAGFGASAGCDAPGSRFSFIKPWQALGSLLMENETPKGHVRG